MEHPKENSHWYDKAGNPAYTMIGRNGQERPTTLRDAKKNGLLPSVTTILKLIDKPGLNSWKFDQGVMSALTATRIEGESDKDFLARIKKDAQEQGRKAAERGTNIHAIVQKGFEDALGQEITPEDYSYYASARKTLLEACGDVKWVCEHSFATDRYGGKCDLHTDDYLIDIKSTDKDLETVQTWEEHDLQLAAYDAGIGGKNRRCGILYIHAITKESRVIWIDDKALRKGIKCFRDILAYWYDKNIEVENETNP
jgi:hypothetical protein